MSARVKANTLLVCVLAAAYYWVFDFAKHDAALRPLIPFGDDPYDAVGSFGVITAAIIACVLLVRTFWLFGGRRPSGAAEVFLLRSQMAIVLMVAITIAADAVAMARHPAKWIDAPQRLELPGLLGGLAVFTTVVFLPLRASPTERPAVPFSQWGLAGTALLLALLVLGFYPEQLINGIATHLLTVLVGAVVLFAPMRPLLYALVPAVTREQYPSSAPTHRWLSSPRGRWSIALILGILVGTFAFLGEMSEGPGPTGRLLLVASVFVGLGTGGLLIAYAFLGAPLGL